MFTSVPLKTQARNLGQLFKARGITLARHEMLEALAAVHGAENWQTLRTMEAPPPSATKAAPQEPGPWTLSCGGVFTTGSKEFESLALARRTAQSLVASGEEVLVWAQHADGQIHCVALSPPVVPDTALPEQAEVMLLSGSTAVWSLEACLSDRWGNLNDHGLDYKPSLSEVTPELWSRLASQLVDETSFIARLDDQWGVLVEIELQCWGSDPDLNADLTPADTFEAVTAQTLRRLLELDVTGRFPGVRFALVQGEGLYNGRPGVWAFIGDGQLDSLARTQLGDLLLSL